MTAEELLYTKHPEGYVMGEVFGEFYFEERQILEVMKEYTKHKCQELLEIVAEKAELKIDCLLDSYYNIDKDSILNAVNLDKFIK